MGEKSKTVGDIGESIVSKLLDLIGWIPRQSNIDIGCKKPIPHAINSARSTHGIDAVFQYNCPLFERRQQFVLVSSKYGESYPSSPNSKFQTHMRDLTQAVSCYQVSSHPGQLSNSNFGFTRRFSGVLFWLDNDSEYASMIERLGEVRLTSAELYDEVYLMDNERCAFIYNGLSFVKNTYHKSTMEFFHPQTGYNSTISARVTSSPILPVQYINSSVLPVKIVTSSREEELIILCSDNLESDFLARLISMAQSLSEGWSSRVTLLFPYYDETRHRSIVDSVKMRFRDNKFAAKVSVASYQPTFRNV